MKHPRVLGRLARREIVFSQAAKVPPKIEKPQANNHQCQDLLNYDQQISNAAQKPRHVILVKEKSNDRQSLRKITGADNQQTIERKDI